MANKKEIDILKYIPTGHKNAITRKQLSKITGIDDRRLRDMISEASTDEHPIFNMQDGKGYFLADETESREIRICYLQEHARAVKTMKRAQAILRFYKKITGKSVMRKEKESELEKNQMSIFDYL